MILWRISRHRDLSSLGGLKAAGRWHHAGNAIVYMTETPASALLEVCVHTSANDVPREFTLLKIEEPDIETSFIEIDTLPKNWQTQLELTRDLGTTWLERTSVLLRVPSMTVPETANFLFNPSYKLAPTFRITGVFAYPMPEDWIFASPAKNGKQPYWPGTLYRAHLAPAAKAAGIPGKIGWHRFRHNVRHTAQSQW